MTAPRHSRGDGIGEADGTGRRLGFGGCDDLEHIGPFKMMVGIGGLRGIRAVRGDDESVVGMDESGLLNGMIPRAGMAPRRSVVCMVGVTPGWRRVV